MMMADWQTVSTALIVVGACAYIGRRIWLRFRSLVNTKTEIRLRCGSGCGECGRSRDGCRM